MMRAGEPQGAYGEGRTGKKREGSEEELCMLTLVSVDVLLRTVMLESIRHDLVD
jgi:hypothetical protein